MNKVSFEWKASEQTPELLAAIGLVVTTWAKIDFRLNSILEMFWRDNKGFEAIIPRPFDKRIGFLEQFVTPLYQSEPDELRIFMWFLHRLKTANGQRDDLAHGIVGTITRANEHGARQYRGLMVPNPSKETRFTTFNFEQIKKLGSRLLDLEYELGSVSMALTEVRNASLPNIRVWQDPGGWSAPSMGHRSHRMPRTHLPPSSFRPSPEIAPDKTEDNPKSR